MAMAFCTRRRHRPDCEYHSSAVLDRPGQAGRIVVVEHDAGSQPGLRIEVLHRIGQSAGVAHDGNGAVTQAVHLVEAAGLILRGHQEHVAGGLDPVRVFLAVAIAKRHAGGIVVRQLRQERFIARITTAQHRQAEFPLGQQSRQHFHHQVQSLLRGQATDHADQRQAAARLGGKSCALQEFLLERSLVPNWLALKCCGRKRSLRGSHS